MPKRNDRIPKNHFKKDWQNRVKTWFDQPAKKVARRSARAAKAAAVFPRPVAGLVRPVVHPPTRKYNFKVKLGRGFTLEELKVAGINKFEALSLGIAVDHRRTNRSDKSLNVNVQRLKEYRSKLVLFPKNAKKPVAGEASAEEVAKAQQQTGSSVLPLRERAFRVETVNKSDIDTKTSVVSVLRKARTDARLVGVRAKRKAEKEAQAAATAKKAE